MVDYVKFKLNPTKYWDSLNANSLCTLEHIVDKNSGDVKYTQGTYKNMKLHLSQRQIIVSGSLHKYYNESLRYGKHNHSQFKHYEIQEAIELLERSLDFSAEDGTIQNLEVGVNIELSKPVTSFLNENLILYKWEEPKIETFNGRGQFREFVMSEYYFKIYDKGRQYGLKDNILRIELKSKKSHFFRDSSKALFLSDLARPETLVKLGNKLSKYSNNLLICDSFDSNTISNSKDRHNLLDYRNPKYWMELKDKSRNRQLNRKKKHFEELRRKYKLDRLNQEIQGKISVTVSELIDSQLVLS